MLFAYRALVFVISAGVHYAALFALLWLGQENSFAFNFNTLEIGIIAGLLQVAGFAFCISPLGYALQKSYYPVRRLSEREEEKLIPLLDEIMAAYKEKKHARIKRVELFMMDDPDENALAFGKNKIAITTGLLNRLKWRDHAIEGVLAHELGHLHHRDLWFWYYVEATGSILRLLYGALNMMQRIVSFLSDLFLPFIIFALPLQIVCIVFSYLIVFLRLPEDILGRMEVYFSRSIEYRADKFSADLIGTKGILSFLEGMKNGEHYMEFGFLNMKRRSHPPSELRIENLHMHSTYEKPVAIKQRIKTPKNIVQSQKYDKWKSKDEVVLY
ncbi:MAG: hypothetical protein COB14_07465 [Alphaproteobacteria bacterium]|nr:MAG: hypothetical protein COB14_07465 [Alphaproteobacteria bacterium]